MTDAAHATYFPTRMVRRDRIGKRGQTALAMVAERNAARREERQQRIKAAVAQRLAEIQSTEAQRRKGTS